MLKEYKITTDYGYKNDITFYYLINNKDHGLQYHWNNNKNEFWFKGFLNMGIEYGHWLDNYNKYLYYL